MIPKDCSDGYILKVDFKYPKELHDLYNDYLQHPRKLQIKHDMLYNYCEIIVILNVILKLVVPKNLLQIWIAMVNMVLTIETCNYIYHAQRYWLVFIGF